MPVLTSLTKVSEVDLKIKQVLIERREVRHPQYLNTLLYASRSVGGRGLKEQTNINLQRNQDQVSFNNYHL